MLFSFPVCTNLFPACTIVVASFPGKPAVTARPSASPCAVLKKCISYCTRSQLTVVSLVLFLSVILVHGNRRTLGTSFFLISFTPHAKTPGYGRVGRVSTHASPYQADKTKPGTFRNSCALPTGLADRPPGNDGRHWKMQPGVLIGEFPRSLLRHQIKHGARSFLHELQYFWRMLIDGSSLCSGQFASHGS